MNLRLHAYGMRLRPFGIGCQPLNHYDYRDATKKDTGYYGIITYARMLSKAEIEQYELTYLDQDSVPQ